MTNDRVMSLMSLMIGNQEMKQKVIERKKKHSQYQYNTKASHWLETDGKLSLRVGWRNINEFP